jgi:hypothetical protein
MRLRTRVRHHVQPPPRPSMEQEVPMNVHIQPRVHRPKMPVTRHGRLDAHTGGSERGAVRYRRTRPSRASPACGGRPGWRATQYSAYGPGGVEEIAERRGARTGAACALRRGATRQRRAPAGGGAVRGLRPSRRGAVPLHTHTPPRRRAVGVCTVERAHAVRGRFERWGAPRRVATRA